MQYLTVFLLALTCVHPANAQFADFNDEGVTFGHMHLVVEDVELHKSLWLDLFDAELADRQGYSALRIADALIFLREGTPTAPSEITAADHFGLEVRDLEEVLSRWRALGYEADSERTDADGRSSAHITMPGGVRLALYENSGQTETASMGYVRFVTTDRHALMAWYSARFGATKPTQGDAMNALVVPGSGLRFEDSETERLPTDGAAIDHVGFEVEHWDSFIAMLEEEQTEFEFGPVFVESLDLWVAFFNDPSGVLVEITHGLDRY